MGQWKSGRKNIMPWRIRKFGGKWVVYNEQTQRVVGTHTSELKAKKHKKALEINVHDKKISSNK